MIRQRLKSKNFVRVAAKRSSVTETCGFGRDRWREEMRRKEGAEDKKRLLPMIMTVFEQQYFPCFLGMPFSYEF